MAHLAPFISIGDRTGLEGCHRSKGCIEPWGQAIKILLAKGHPADIKPKTEILVMPKHLAKALPLVCRA